jgi:hypothetical protein
MPINFCMEMVVGQWRIPGPGLLGMTALTHLKESGGGLKCVWYFYYKERGSEPVPFNFCLSSHADRQLKAA